MSRLERSAAAYRHVDLSKFPDEVRAEIADDADAGGRQFGVRVVEIAHNGSSQTSIYGVYLHDEDTWDAAKTELGITEESGEVDLTAAAQQSADAQAAATRAAEEAELARIAGIDDTASSKKK